MKETETITYVPETAESLYAELERAAALVPDYEGAYGQLGRTFRKCLNEQTFFDDVRLVGTFAKLDYLLKEHDAPKLLWRRSNDTRVRLHEFAAGRMGAEAEARWWSTDVETVALLVQWLYQVPVPDVLFAQLEERKTTPDADSGRDGAANQRRSLGDVVRMVVTRWDDACIYGRLETDGVEEAKVSYARWEYLRDLLQEGSQLNLVRPQAEGDILVAELIILEPDYLVDVSAVASCFATYAESPLVGLMNRLSPSETTGAILQGQLASQFLDEELRDECRPYAESAMDFFRQNALSLLTTELPSSFHSDAGAQKMNIHNAIGIQLPLLAQRYNREEVVVEPSFVCEMLGLQGRMDFLQLDFRVLIEQKSGKAAFVPHDPTPDTPRQREEHYVQMLLYMAILRYNYRTLYEQNQRQLHAFLLYSRYPKALLGLGFAPELLWRAIRLRNSLAAQDMRLAQDGFGFLETLTADQLNEKQLEGKLWEQYIRPRLEGVLSPLRDASELERRYVLRMLRFVAAEHQLSKLGNKTKESSGFSCLWHDSLEEKLAAGNIYDRLRLLSPVEGEGKVERVVLSFPSNGQNDTSNFRTGDIVLLYPYGRDAQPDVRRTIVFRGTIARISLNEIEIGLRNAQTDAHVFLRDKDKFWAVEHDFMEASYSTLYRGLHAFLSAPCERRDLLMLQRQPEIDEHRALKGEYGEFDELARRVKQARDMFLIVGPPGTGKTSYGMLYTLQEELLEEGTSVLIMSYTNRAVDEICSKLHGTIDFVRIGSALSCSPEYKDCLLNERMKGCRNVAELRQLVERTRVFVGTTTALSSALALFQLKRFSLAIIDEASQILEPHLMALLSATHCGKSAIRKFVMIGDHKQLPAVVQQRPSESQVTEPLLREIGLTDCRLSLFERLLRRYGDDPRYSYMLTRQGRMHPDIAEFPNRAFYQGRLKVVPLVHQTPPSDPSHLIFVDVPSPQDSPSDKVNQAEADVIASQVLEVYRECGENFDASDVGVIVPYRNQIATVRSTIDQLGVSALRGITIDTVERYQGSQRKVIVYGFTIQQHYQLRFLTDTTFVEGDAVIDRKLNVAMTRAQERLVMVGNARLLSVVPLFARLLDFVRQRGTYLYA